MEEKQLEAVGISYDEKQGKAPTLSAKGVADRAQAIVDMACLLYTSPSPRD